MTPSPVVTAKQLWLQHCKSLKDIPSCIRKMTVALADSFTLDNLVPHLGGNLLKGFSMQKLIVESGFDILNDLKLKMKGFEDANPLPLNYAAILRKRKS